MHSMSVRRNKSLSVSFATMVLLGLLFVVGGIFSFQNVPPSQAEVKSSEVGFVSYSPRGAGGGAIVPASCELNEEHFPGQCGEPPPPPVNFTLSISRLGTGRGTVTSDPVGINCGSSCSAVYVDGTSVALTASASANSVFAGWSGDCSGVGVCNVDLIADRSVAATFDLFDYSLSNSGTSRVTKTSGNAFVQNTITKTLTTSGGTGPVTLSLTGVPVGTSYSISNAACSPTCTSVIT